MFKRIATTATLVALLFTSKANADLVFAPSGVWQQPRIYSGSSEVQDYNNIQLGSYSFRTRLDEADGVPSTTTLLGEITGPNNFYASNFWSEINLSEFAQSYRMWTDELTEFGNHTITFTLQDGQTISRDFTTIDEADPLYLLGFGLTGLGIVNQIKKRKLALQKA